MAHLPLIYLFLLLLFNFDFLFVPTTNAYANDMNV